MDTRQIKAANPIETVAARYATLHRAGANYKMLCPFHDDHHPSLSLHVAGQYFKCHACGAGGDVIGLVMGLEKCSFAEAVKKLGGDSCQHNTTNNCATKSNPSPLERGQGVCHSHPEKLSAEQQAFLRSLLPAASGHSELSPTWIDFGVGVAPAFVPDAFRAMRSRIIFPIRDETGRLTGFGARRIDGKDGAPSGSSPKYINTANNGLFDKSRTLYGIDRAAGAIREAGFVFVVEGYKDVLAMHAAGYRHTVGLCGTALTDGQAEILARHTSCLHLLLDGDGPGRNAATKIAGERRSRFAMRLSFIPSGEDPDELFRRLGKADFRTYLRYLTTPGQLCARRLLAWCLDHRATAPLLERMMETDDMPFADSDYRDMLHFLALRPAEELSGWPEELQVLAGFLRSLAAVLFPPPPDLAGVPEGMYDGGIPLAPETILRILLTEYYEERVISEARTLRSRLSRTPPALRPPLLHSLHHHFHLLSALTREAERTPAVEERWF